MHKSTRWVGFVILLMAGCVGGDSSNDVFPFPVVVSQLENGLKINIPLVFMEIAKVIFRIHF